MTAKEMRAILENYPDDACVTASTDGEFFMGVAKVECIVLTSDAEKILFCEPVPGGYTLRIGSKEEGFYEGGNSNNSSYRVENKRNAPATSFDALFSSLIGLLRGKFV